MPAAFLHHANESILVVTDAQEDGSSSSTSSWPELISAIVVCAAVFVCVAWKTRQVWKLLGRMLCLFLIQLAFCLLAFRCSAAVLPIVTLSVILWGVWSVCWDGKRARRERPGESDEFEASGVYTDLSYPLEKTYLVFAVQTMLMAIFLSDSVPLMAKLGSPETMWETDKPYLFPSIVVQLYVLLHAKEDFPWKTWVQLWRCSGRVEQLGDRASGGKIIDVGQFEVLIRMIMSFLANMIYSKALVLTMPTALIATTSGIDFVRDAFAVTFISTIDSDSKEVFRYRVAPPETQMCTTGSSRARSTTSLPPATSQPPTDSLEVQRGD
eukprot:TRINITY_DN24732_c0_g2_i1.p1 TRINITY_DN24732_c0_g2~~TRINITY_DN24732_c0_g2_i1.p1  ORF type:complete len:325 (+),score=31.87 TRINITY_DN24732_c0_g2_i1:107-1081(+)